MLQDVGIQGAWGRMSVNKPYSTRFHLLAFVYVLVRICVCVGFSQARVYELLA